MTANEELRHIVEQLSEREAEIALEAIAERVGDPLVRALEQAPPDDEPTSPEEDRAAKEALAQYRRGEAISAGQAKRELL